ncbi:MAG: methyl-accepting chemotaxis protein [Micromonosporaceae bacterium]|nr:methyl-accepting chemotaxis protein [Micromonosporaceae bacterium]
MDRVSIKTRLVGLVGILILALAIMGWAGWTGAASSDEAFDEITEEAYPSVLASLQMEIALTSQADDLASYIAGKQQKDLDEWQADQRLFEHWLARFAELDHSEEEGRLLAGLEGMEQEYVTVGTQATALVRDGKTAEAVDLSSTTLRQLKDQMSAQLTSLVNANRESMQAASEDARDQAAGQRVKALVIPLIAIILGAGIALLTIQSIGRSLARTGRVLEAIAAGDLSRDADVTGNDEITKMTTALNTAIAAVRRLVATATSSAQALSTLSGELSDTTDQIAGSAQGTSAKAAALSTAAEQISRNVRTVAAGSEEMAASIREIASNASEAARVSSTAVHAAQSAMGTVSSLGESSQEVENVLKLINSIAQQTNLLALNATIEAARAGEAGKGFAIVASEVKDLSQKTARATDEVRQRIVAIQRDSTAVSTVIREIVEVIERANDHSGGIASAVEQQTATTSEINRNVVQAAAGSEEVATTTAAVAEVAHDTSERLVSVQAAAGQLDRMSADLLGVVSSFIVR